MIRSLLIALLLLSACSFAQEPASLPKTDVAQVKEWMMTLAGDKMQGRLPGTDASEEAAEWLASQFRKAGLKPRPGSNTFFQSFYTEAKESTPGVRTHNVVGYIKGSDDSIAHPYILFGAHWDHIGMATEGEDLIYNGADDNASGVIACLGVAQNIAQGIRKGLIERPKRTLVFVAWGAEELGLLGSKYFVHEKPPFPMEQLAVNFNFELVGHSAKLGKKKFFLTGADYSDFKTYLEPVAKAHDWEIIANPMPELNLFFRSDNFNFAGIEIDRPAKKLTGIPAHTFSTWGGEDHYHQVHDNPEAIDFENLSSFIDVMTAATLVMANQDAVPQWQKDETYTFERYQGEKADE